MNEIITRCLEDKEVAFLAEMPRELMTEEEGETVTFILDFYQEFGVTPEIGRVMDKHSAFVPFLFSPTTFEKTPPPIGDVFQQTIERKLISATTRKMRKAEAIIEKDGIVPIEIFAEIEKLHALSLGISKYSTFDRDLYFRRKALDLPFSIINSYIGGISNGDFMLLVGRLGTGKSTIAQHIAHHIWAQGKKILFISAEMLTLDVFSRIDAMIGKFNPLELRKGKTGEMERILGTVYKKVNKEPGEIVVPRSRILSPQQIASYAKNLQVDLIIVDGAYLLRPSSGNFSSKWERVATVSNELKQMALDLQLPVIATAQIKRGADGEEGYTPEDIAQSDALGQDSDFVVAIWPNPVLKEKMQLQLMKNRYGPLTTTQIYIDYDTMTVSDEKTAGTAEEKEVHWKDWK